MLGGNCCCGCTILNDTFVSGGSSVTAWRPPGTCGTGIAGDVAWLNVNNAKLDDGSNATNQPGTSYSEYLKTSNYGFTIPAGSTISGIEVRVQRYASAGSSIKDYDVHLFRSDTSAFYGSGKVNTNFWASTEESVTYGGAGDVWGSTLTAAQVNASTFGVGIALLPDAGYRVAYIDFVEIRIYYSSTSPSGDWTIISGTWTVNDYLSTASANALIISTNDHPDAEAENILSGTILGGAGDIGIIIISYKDTNNYLYCEVQFNNSSGSCGYVALKQKVAGTVTTLAIQIPNGPLPNQFITYRVCFSAEEKTLTARVGTINVSHTFATVPFADGYKVGYSTTTTLPTILRFYNTTWSKHFSTANPECTNCAEISNPTACIILETYFNGYTVGHGAGCNFSLVTGDWDTVAGNPAGGSSAHIECKTDGGILQCIVPEPKLSNKHVLTVTFAILDRDIEAGAFINYSTGANRYTASAELYPDNTVAFRLYNNGTLIDYDILPIIDFPGVAIPDPFSGQILVYMCLDFDDDGLQVTYEARDYSHPSNYGTTKHTMWDFNATGNTNGYYAGLEVVNNDNGFVYVPYYYFNYKRSKANDPSCYECDFGCYVSYNGIFAVPCYLKLEFENFKDNRPCNYGYTQDCNDFNGIWFVGWKNNQWESGPFTAGYCYGPSYTGTFYWIATLTREYNSATSSFGWKFHVRLQPYSGVYYWYVDMYTFTKWFADGDPPNLFSWIDENIPWSTTDNGAYIPACGSHSDPPTLKVSYADLDVP